MASYAVPPVIEQVHAWRRFDISDVNRQVSSDFNPDFNSAAGRAYIASSLSIAGVYFAFGILAFLFFVALNSAYVCCCKQRAPRPAEGVLSLLTGPRVWVILVVIGTLAGAATGIAQIEAFRQGVAGTVGAIERLDSLLSNTSTAVATGLVPALTTAQGVAGNFCTDANIQAPAVAPAVCSLGSSIGSAADASSNMASQLNSTASSLSSQLRAGGSVDVDALGQRVFAGGVAVLAIYLAWVLSLLPPLTATPCCAQTWRVCNAVLVVVLLLVFIFTGFFTAISVVGADVCAAPSLALQRVANLTNTSADATATLVFYTTCNPAAVYNSSVGGAYGRILSGQDFVANASTSLADLSVALSGQAWATPYLTSLNTQLAQTNVSLNGIIASVSCAPVNNIYADMLSSLCSKGIVGVIHVWGLGTAACFLIFILAIAGSRLCWWHPGDDEGTEPTGPTPRGVTMSTMPPAISLYGGRGASGAPAAYGNASAYSAAAPREWR